MNPFQQKYFVFFISGGRTGTKFFGDVLSNCITNSFSIHEPDVVHFKKGETTLLSGIKNFGLYWMVFGRVLGKTGIRNLSDSYLSGRCPLNIAGERLKKYRSLYYKAIKKQLIIESYSGWYGLIPVIQAVYSNYKIVILIRDPRDWVRSNMDWGTMYGRRDWVSKLGFRRLSPFLVYDTVYRKNWRKLDQFQKLCWAWHTIYEALLAKSAMDSNIQIFKFEDVFYSDQRIQNFKYLIRFISNFSDKQFDFNSVVNIESILNQQIHKNVAYDFPSWPDWSNQRAQALDHICGDLMKSFGYGEEELWKNKLTAFS
jgi:phage pi2 protein 07